MKDYELTVIFHPDLEMNTDPAIDKVKKIITSVKGEIKKEENDGKKRLAYGIKGQDFGIYCYFDVALPPEAPAKIESTFNITDEVLRHLLVATDPRKAKMAARRGEQDTDAEESTKSTEEKGE